MAGNSVGVQDCEIHVHNSSLPSTLSQDNVESSLDILSTIQRATRPVVQIYHELFSLSKNDFIEALHDLGSIQELRLLFVQRSYPEIFIKLWETVTCHLL